LFQESLKYRLLGSEGDIGSWGHEYVRNLAGEIAQEFQKRQDDDMPIDALMELVQQIVSFHMKHNAEPEAVDLLMEVEDLDLLVEHVDSTNYKRTCLYLTSSSKYVNTFLFCFLPPLYVSFSTCCILFYAVDPVVLIWQDFLGVAEFCTLVLNFN
jgi:hypothetical protein